jgi:sugar phosphate isomerase/epimerase
MSMNQPVQAGPKLGATLFAFTNPYHARRMGFEDLLRKVAALGIGPGVEVIGFSSIRNFPTVTDDFAARFKALVEELGLQPTSLAINADAALRRGTRMDDETMARYLEPQIRAAAKLGFPVVRSQFGATPEATRMLVPLLESLNIKLGPEVHAPLGPSSPPVLAYREMYDKVNSPLLGFVPDFGTNARDVPPGYVDLLRRKAGDEEAVQLALSIWRGPGDAFWKREEFNRQAAARGTASGTASALSVVFSMLTSNAPESWSSIMSQIIHVHGKFYEFDASGEETAIPCRDLMRVFTKGGYRGWISAEWEGHMYSQEDGFDQVVQFQKLCRRYIAEALAE